MLLLQRLVLNMRLLRLLLPLLLPLLLHGCRRGLLGLQLGPQRQGGGRLRLHCCLQQLRSHGWGPQHACHRISSTHQPRAVLLQRLGSRRHSLPICGRLRCLLLTVARMLLLKHCRCTSHCCRNCRSGTSG